MVLHWGVLTVSSVCLQPAPAWTTFRVGLYCGVFLVLIVTVVITGKTHACSSQTKCATWIVHLRSFNGLKLLILLWLTVVLPGISVSVSRPEIYLYYFGSALVTEHTEVSGGKNWITASDLGMSVFFMLTEDIFNFITYIYVFDMFYFLCLLLSLSLICANK